IAEVCRQRRAGGDRIADLRRRRRGVAERDAYTCGHEVLDERHRAGNFRGERHQHDAAAGGILPSLEVLDAGRDDVGARMRAARAAASSTAADSRWRYTVVRACCCRADAGARGDTPPRTHDSTARAFLASGTTQMISRDFRICRMDIEIARDGTSATDANQPSP